MNIIRPQDIVLRIAIVGAGPRGTSALERVCSSAPSILDSNISLEVYIIDPSPPGPGSVWNTRQSPLLLMNSVASQVTGYPDKSVEIAGPKPPGLNLYQWAVTKQLHLGPNDYPTRVQHGQYWEWIFEKTEHEKPRNISIQVRSAFAVSLDNVPDNGQTLTLSTGDTLHGLSAVILAQGHLQSQPDTEQRCFIDHASQHNLRYIPPANPADINLSTIPKKSKVLLRGLGLCFFDYMALLTEGRGGTYTRTSRGLRYHPSNEEPYLYAFSRLGLPLHARANNAKGPDMHHTPLVLTEDIIQSFRDRAGSHDAPNFRKEVWPLIAMEVEVVSYECILKELNLDRPDFRVRFLATPYDRSQASRILDDFDIPVDRRWSWDLISRPYSQHTFATAREWTDWLLEYLREDVRQAALGNVESPLKAALDVLRDLRNAIRDIVDYDGLSGVSRRDDLDNWYTPLNYYLSIGPPRQRTEQTIALIEAGILHVLGPETDVQIEERGWTARCPGIPSDAASFTTLTEARMSKPILRQTTDKLLVHLLNTGQCRPHTVDGYETGGLDVTRDSYRLIDAEGRAHERRFAIGVPTKGVHWVTTAVARPGANSVMLRETDAVAREALKLVARDATR